jgi:hypothetical protein
MTAQKIYNYGWTKATFSCQHFLLISRPASQEFPHLFTEHESFFLCSREFVIWPLPWASCIHILAPCMFNNSPDCLHSMMRRRWVALPNRQRSTLKSATIAFVCNYCFTTLDSSFTHRLGWSIRSGALPLIPLPQARGTKAVTYLPVLCSDELRMDAASWDRWKDGPLSPLSDIL